MEPSGIEKHLWGTRDILHRAVQMHIASDVKGAEAATKNAYQHLTSLLDKTQSNLKIPEK